MGIEDTEQFYNPVNSKELELLEDFRAVDAEDRNIIHTMLKRFKVGRRLVEEKAGVVNNNLGGTNLIAIGGGNNYNTMTP